MFNKKMKSTCRTMGENTAIKKLMIEKFTENIELQNKLGHTTEDLFCKTVKVTKLKKKGMFWTGKFTVSYTVEGQLPVHYVDRILARKNRKEKNEKRRKEVESQCQIT